MGRTPISTLQNFGIPTGPSTGRAGIIQPKPKHRFRVVVFQFGAQSGGLEFTQQVMTVSRPTRVQNPVEVHAYNSTAYYGGKATWNSIELTLRDDVTNSVSKMVGYQEQKQMNHFEQTSPLSGTMYKFHMKIDTLDGGNSVVLETWDLEGCFLENVNYDSFDYSSAEPMTISMSIRYDNATQEGGLMPLNPAFSTGVNV